MPCLSLSIPPFLSLFTFMINLPFTYVYIHHTLFWHVLYITLLKNYLKFFSLFLQSKNWTSFTYFNKINRNVQNCNVVWKPKSFNAKIVLIHIKYVFEIVSKENWSQRYFQVSFARCGIDVNYLYNVRKLTCRNDIFIYILNLQIFVMIFHIFRLQIFSIL